MMIQKKFPYWLKGGLIGISLYVVILSTAFMNFLGTNIVSSISFLIILFSSLPLTPLVGDVQRNFRLFLVILPFFYFLVGAGIGLVVTKLKK